MEIVKETRRLISHRDILLPATWRYMVKAIWLFFPSIIFLLLAHFAFWHITQGQDLMVIALENNQYFISPVFFCFILALLFWVIVTWYTTRIVARARDFQEPDHHHIWRIFIVQSPRVLAFTCITIILLAFLQLQNSKYDMNLPGWLGYCLLVFSYVWYYIIYVLWGRFLDKKNMTVINWISFLKKIRIRAYLVLSIWIIAVVMIKTRLALVGLLLGMQIGLVLLLMLRRELDEAKKEQGGEIDKVDVTPASPTWKKIRYIVTRKEDRQYFKVFQLVSALGIVVYLLAISFLNISMLIGSFSFMLLAFGVLLGIGNFIATVSVFTRFNFHLLFFLFSLLLGKFFDPHFTKIIDKPVPTVLFSDRQTLKNYFMNWVKSDSARHKILEDNATKKYPVYFVIANGGASRSGYWVSSVLSALQDTTKGKFSQHLFCLSGASGGSVGNAVFFNLLRAQNERLKKDSSRIRFWNASTKFLESDFLSFTLTRLLGRDIFRHILPVSDHLAMDRANALAYSLERAAGEKNFLSDSFAAPFSSFITQTKQTQYQLPILCINTTRMQDGSPGVISNIRIRDKENYFNKRIDVLSLLDEKDDIKLSTAVVLGASFPYLSPAGRINSNTPGMEGAHYFVDGGYFDNSGAGVVNEMLIAIKDMMQQDSSFDRYKNKLDFYVLHITNNDKKKSNLHRINPFTNDLLAPVQTILGSYGTQTLVNDQRLINFLASMNQGNGSHYINIDLYGGHYEKKFSMNWVISNYQRRLMDKNLMTNDNFKKLCDTIRSSGYLK